MWFKRSPQSIQPDHLLLCSALPQNVPPFCASLTVVLLLRYSHMGRADAWVTSFYLMAIIDVDPELSVTGEKVNILLVHP